jgi:hypothetical protein
LRFTRAARTDFKIDPRTDKVTIVLSSDHLNGNIRIALEKILNRPGDDELNEWRRTSQPGARTRNLGSLPRTSTSIEKSSGVLLPLGSKPSG